MSLKIVSNQIVTLNKTSLKYRPHELIHRIMAYRLHLLRMQLFVKSLKIFCQISKPLCKRQGKLCLKHLDR